jgi:ribosomal protein L40E
MTSETGSAAGGGRTPGAAMGAKPAVPATKACPQCLETIPLAATRCRACTSSV